MPKNTLTPGARLRRARLALDLTQEELARDTRLSLSTIKDAEHDRHVPRRDNRREIAAALGVPPDALWPKGGK